MNSKVRSNFRQIRLKCVCHVSMECLLEWITNTNCISSLEWLLQHGLSFYTDFQHVATDVATKMMPVRRSIDVSTLKR